MEFVRIQNYENLSCCGQERVEEHRTLLLEHWLVEDVPICTDSLGGVFTFL